MPSKEIPRAQWDEFATSFSRQHQHWLTTIEVDQGGRTQVLAEDSPLQYMTTRGDAQVHIGVRTTDDPQRTIDHVVQQATRVVFEETEHGAHKGVHIESESGKSFDLSFRTAMPPEQVDGKVEQ